MDKNDNLTPHNGRSPHLVASQTQIFSGPIPPAEEFARYNTILPGAANRILTMAEHQSKHRHKIETVVIYGGTAKSIIGMILGFLLAIFTIWCGYRLISNGKSAEGVAAIVLALGGLVTAFLYGTHQQKKAREKNEVKR